MSHHHLPCWHPAENGILEHDTTLNDASITGLNDCPHQGLKLTCALNTLQKWQSATLPVHWQHQRPFTSLRDVQAPPNSKAFIFGIRRC